MSKFKEWDVVYHLTDDMLMIFRGLTEWAAWCEYPYAPAVNTVITRLDSLVYIGQLWTDKERKADEIQRTIAFYEDEIRRYESEIENLKHQIKATLK